MNVSIPLTSIARGAPDADLLRRIAETDRKLLEQFVAAAIDALDVVDGDPDLEEDDPCGQIDEDGVNTVLPDEAYRWVDRGPGCVYSDPESGEQPLAFKPQCSPLFPKRR